MKRILILLLALVMCLGCLAACNTPGGGEETTVDGETQAPDNADAATLTDAVKYLRSIYKDSAKETPADYDVVGKVVIGDTEFAVTWTTDNADIVVKVSEKNAAFYTIDIPVKNDEAKDYKLTATVTDANGDSESVSFDRALPVYDSSAIVDKPEEQQAYKFYMIHASLGQTLFATAETQDDKYIKTTTDPKAGLDFYTEADGEGFKFYTEIGGTKMYVKASTTTSDDGKVSKYIAYSAEEGTTWIYKTETNAWYTTIDNLEYVVGTYGTYNTICISDSSYMTPETSGKTQFPAGLMKKDVAEAMTPSEGPTIYETPEEIVNAAYELELGAVLSGGHKYTLTGVITSIPTPWSDEYGNITVVIVVNGMEDKPIECFRLKGDGANTLAVGDTITVTGVILKYDNKSETGKVEFNAGCTLGSGSGSGNGGGSTEKPDTSLSVSNPTADGVYKLYLVQVNTGKTLFANGETDQDKFLKGTTDAKAGLDFRAEIVDGGYKFYTEIGGAKKYLHAYTTTDDAGKISKFLCYADSTDAVWSYKAETNGWYVTIGGAEYVAGTYNTFDTFSISDSKFLTAENSGKSQFPLNLVEKAVAEGDDFGGSDEPETPDTPSAGLDAQAPKAGTAYKVGFLQGNQNKIYYLTGVLSGFYMASTETFAEGADFYVEETNGGYYLYCMVDGAKKYVNAKSVTGTDGKNHINGLFEDTASSVYTYDETLKTLVTVIDGTNYIYGTRNDKTYSTLGPMKADSGCFHAVLVTKAGSAETPDTPDTPVIPDTPTEGLNAKAPVAGTAYKFGFLQGNKNQVYYLTGVLSGYYMASTETFSEGVDFFVEETNGGYYLYCMVGGAKKYVNMVVSGNYVNGKYEDSATSVYTYDETLKTLKSVVNGTDYIFGTRADGTYTTLGPMKASSGCFHAVLVTEAGSVPSGGGSDDTPDTPDTPATGEGVSEVKVDTPYYLFGVCGSGTNYFSGTVKSGRIDGTTAKGSAVSVKLEAGSAAGEYYIYFMNGNTKTYIAVDGGNDSSSFALVTEKSDACLWVIDNSAKTIISKTMSSRGIATQVASKYTNFSTYATSNFGTAEYQATWFMAA